MTLVDTPTVKNDKRDISTELDKSSLVGDSTYALLNKMMHKLNIYTLCSIKCNSTPCNMAMKPKSIPENLAMKPAMKLTMIIQFTMLEGVLLLVEPLEWCPLDQGKVWSEFPHSWAEGALQHHQAATEGL